MVGRNGGARTRRVAGVAGLLCVVALTASGCSRDEVIGFGWPKGVTPQADEMRQLWTWSVIASLVVGVIVWGLIIWSVVFHRKKHASLPKQFQYNHGLEFVYTVVPLVVVCVLFYFTATVQSDVTSHSKTDMQVNVTAFQWNWEFQYPGYKTPNGQSVATIGSSQEIPLLVLPVGRSINYSLRSNDVIHSFFVPEFHFKRDVFPDPDKNNQDSQFQNTIDQTGSFVGRCAELCGTYHSMMNFEVRALPANLFDQYMTLRTQLNPQTHQPYTASEALTKLGKDDTSCGDLCTPHAVTTKPFDTSRTQNGS